VRIVNAGGPSRGGHLDHFFRHCSLCTMLWHLNSQDRLRICFDGFIAICQRHPGVGVPVRTTEPYGKIPWHERSLKILVETVLCEEGALSSCIGNRLPTEFVTATRRMTDSGASRGRSPAGEGRGCPLGIFTCSRKSRKWTI